MLVRAKVLLMPVSAWFILIPKTSSTFCMCLAPKSLHIRPYTPLLRVYFCCAV